MIVKSTDERAQVKIVGIEELMPKKHLLRMLDKAYDWNSVYEMTEKYYCEDNGRPCVDPVILLKMALIQHMYGYSSLRKTVQKIDENIAYRWFLHYNLDTEIPHFATVSYAFATRFPSDLFREFFGSVLSLAVSRGLVDAKTVFTDSTHVKASANKKKNIKLQVEEVARSYDEKLREEINRDRVAHGKKPLKEREKQAKTKEITVSTTDPECGMFHKGEHERQFAYTVHTTCDENNIVLDYEVTPANVHDSRVFNEVYEPVTEAFSEIEAVALDAGYKTPAICKEIIDGGKTPVMPYTCPKTKKGLFGKNDFIYHGGFDCIVCPNKEALTYSTTNRKGYREYKSNPKICQNCPLRSKCTSSSNMTKVFTRHIWQDYIEQAEDFRRTPEGRAAYSKRKQTIERVFAEAKENHGMRYTHIRGRQRVENWVALKYAAMNLKKIAMRAA